MTDVALWAAGIGAVLAAIWAAVRGWKADARERLRADVLAKQAELRAARLRLHAQRDAEVEARRITEVGRVRDEVETRKADAAVDIESAEAELRKRTDEPWEP